MSERTLLSFSVYKKGNKKPIIPQFVNTDHGIEIVEYGDPYATIGGMVSMFDFESKYSYQLILRHPYFVVGKMEKEEITNE